MVQTLKAEDLSKAYGEKKLFQDINFIVNEHDRIGLIGTNGSGKTSLLNVIARIDGDYTGKIEKPKNYSIAYLKQTPELDPNKTILEAVFSGEQETYRIINNYERRLANYTNHPEDKKAAELFENAEAQMNENDAWNAESEVKTILNQLKITDLGQKIKNLSGGQQKRVGLAQVLIEAPDLLILDEPTNHLDFESIDWLTKYLSNYHGALILVTHDRYFLDAISNSIFELSFGKLYKYSGNYQDYVAKKAEREENASQFEKKQQKLYKTELSWMKRGAKARSTKQNAREERFKRLETDIKKTREKESSVEINLKGTRLGKKVIEFKNANLNVAGHQILKDFNWLVQNGDRIGITGENGAGKTSLLNAIAGKIPLNSGTLEIGETVKLGYYTQQMPHIDENKRVINYLEEIGESVVDKDGKRISVSTLLEQFLFPKTMHGTLIRKLSGGEKRRLYLVQLLMQKPNVLLLDEPTNNLDINTLTVLEDYLKHFDGTTITVSHDRYFLDKVADQLLLFKGNGGIANYSGEYSQYLAEQKNKKSQKEAKKPGGMKKTADTKKEKTKLTYAEKLEWDKIDNKIDGVYKKIKEINADMEQSGSDFEKLSKLQAELEEQQRESDRLTKRWEYLSQFV